MLGASCWSAGLKPFLLNQEVFWEVLTKVVIVGDRSAGGGFAEVFIGACRPCWVLPHGHIAGHVAACVSLAHCMGGLSRELSAGDIVWGDHMAIGGFAEVFIGPSAI